MLKNKVSSFHWDTHWKELWGLGDESGRHKKKEMKDKQEWKVVGVGVGAAAVLLQFNRSEYTADGGRLAKCHFLIKQVVHGPDQ